jgi:hypothetical protein
VRKQAKEWYASVGDRKHQEALVVYVERPDARATGGGLFRVQSSVLDRMRTDFNSDKRDRCGTIIPAPL